MSYTQLHASRREIECLKMCHHNCFAKLFDVFENEDSIFLVLEYLKGGDLYDYLLARNFKVGEKRV
jgi:serine/threonine protein kinase